MLIHVSIKNFAVIKSLEMDLGGGLSIFTGETGAGKSVIIQAISMGLGARADSDYIRTGEEKAVIGLAFDGCGDALKALLEDQGIEPDDLLVIRREIWPGRSVCRINGTIVTLSQLAAVCRGLADIHGQYDHQYLLRPESHLEVLDRFAGEKLSSLKAETEKAFARYTEASSQLMRLRKGLADARRRKDLLSFELAEIEAARIAPGEDDELAERIALMENSEKIFEEVAEAYELLYSSDRNAVGLLEEAARRLETAGAWSEDARTSAETVNDACYRVDDLRQALRRLRDSISYSQQDLDDAIDRQQLLSSLKRKYGGTLQSVIDHASEAAEELQTIENADERVEALEAEISAARAAYDELAYGLSAERKSAALTLQKLTDRELSELDFKDADLVVSFEDCPPTAGGTDRVEFLISANRGEAPRPLAKVASGGELSRIMLALKRITGDLDGIPTMIFDEIDTGISGSTAGIVGEKLKSIASGRQVVCITHLPQIACLGDAHYKIIKSSDDETTMTDIQRLDMPGRVEEISRLLSGTRITEAARAQARELLGLGEEQQSFGK